MSFEYIKGGLDFDGQSVKLGKADIRPCETIRRKPCRGKMGMAFRDFHLTHKINIQSSFGKPRDFECDWCPRLP